MSNWATKAAEYATTMAVTLALVACGGGSEGSSGASSDGGSVASAAGTTSGADFSAPSTVDSESFEATVTENDGSIDTASVAQGIVMAQATSASKLKFLVTCGDMSYNYDLPGDGTTIVCPVNMGDGAYSFAIMRNTGGSDYVQTTETTVDVKLDSEFVPFTHPNVFCNYDESSACVAKARELTSACENQGDAVRAICTYVVDNVSYDTEKAAELSGTSGYVPDPDTTLASGKGICFDFASLGAAMLRSVGIPAKIVTGYVSPEDLYHAWIMVYIDGSWTGAQFSVNPQTWSRMDLTFAADSSNDELVGDGKTYTDRYVY